MRGTETRGETQLALYFRLKILSVLEKTKKTNFNHYPGELDPEPKGTCETKDGEWR